MLADYLHQSSSRGLTPLGLTVELENEITNYLQIQEILNTKTDLIKRPHKERGLSIKKFDMDRNETIRIREERRSDPRVSGFTGRAHFSKAELEELRPIALSDMMVPRIHRGNYLLCRTVVNSYTIFGVNSLIEDTFGNVEHLELFNFQVDLRDDPNTFLPMGTILIMKEPYLRYGNRTEVVSIRCDSPSDVIFLESHDERLRVLAPNWFFEIFPEEILENLEEANNSFRLKKYEESIKFYNRALHVEPENGTILLNKSAAFIQLNRYWEAYDEAKRAYGRANVDEMKVLYCLGTAAYGLRNWKLASEHFSAMLVKDPTNPMVSNELEKTRTRMLEELHGHYEMEYLYDESREQPYRSMDVADYVGPVKIAEIKGKGKGLITTKDVEKGTLLLASKSISGVVYNAPFRTINFHFTNGYVQGGRIVWRNLDAKATLIFQTIQMIKNNPHRANELYSLFSGDIDRNDVLPFEVIDPGRIENVCTFNSNYGDRVSSSMLLVLPSFINHSCLPNSIGNLYGDFAMVRCLRDLKKGEEITISYWNPRTEPYKSRLELAFQLQFRCECPICKLDARDPFCEEREALFKEMQQKEAKVVAKDPDDRDKEEIRKNDHRLAVKSGIILLRKIRDTYENRTQFRYRLGHSLFIMAQLYLLASDVENAICSLTEAIEELGDLNSEYTEMQFYMAHCFKKLSNSQLAEECLQKAVENDRISKGINNIRLFKHVHYSLLKQLDVYSSLKTLNSA